MNSPSFSSFRDLMDRWDKQLILKEELDAINNLLDKHDLILFFKKGDDLFGAPEESRLILPN